MSIGPTDAQLKLMAQARTTALTNVAQMVARLPQLRRWLRPFSASSVVPPLAGLLTMAQHQAATRRISALIHIALRCCKGTREPRHGELNRWLHQIQDDPLTHLEDPVDDVHVSNVLTVHGNRRLFQGNLDSTDYYLQQTLHTLHSLQRGWVQPAAKHAHALLAVSEVMAERVGHTRYTLASNEPRTEIRLTEEIVSDLVQRVTFDHADLERMGVSLQQLSPFLLDPKGVFSAQEFLGHTYAERRPILVTGEEVKTILPHALGPAAERYLCERVVVEGDRRRFDFELTQLQVKDFASLAARNWNIRPSQEFRGDASSGVVDCVGTFDRGAYVHMVYVPDDVRAIVHEGLESTHDLGESVRTLTGRNIRRLSGRPDYRRGLTLLVHGGVGRSFAARLNRPPAGWHILCLSIADFCHLSWDTGISALRTWKILNQRHLLEERGMYVQCVGGFVDLYGFLKAHQFFLVPPQLSVSRGASVAIWPEFASGLRQSVRADVDLHNVRAPDGKTWIGVQRKSLGPTLPTPGAIPIYASREYAERGELMGCVKTDLRPWWVRASSHGPENPRGQFLYGVWESTVNLLSRLAPLFDKDLPMGTVGPVVCRLRFPDIRDFSLDVEEGDRVSEAPRVHVTGTTATIDYLAVHLRQFAQADNRADRNLAKSLVTAAFGFAGLPTPADPVVAQWTGRVIASDRARSFHMTPVRTAEENIYSTVPIPRPRFEKPEDRAWSWLRVAEEAGYTGPPGPLPDDVVPRVLRGAVEAVWKRISDRLVTLERRSVIECALANWESIQEDRAEWRRTAAALLAVHENDDAVIEMANRRENDRTVAGLASRVIAEMALCTAPMEEGMVCTATDLDELIALVSRLLDCAAQSDAHYYKLANSPPIAHSNGGLEFGGAAAATLGPYWATVGERHFREDASRYADAFAQRDQRDKPPEDLEAAFRAEFGLGFHDCFEILNWLTDECLERNTIQFVLSRTKLMAKLRELGLQEPGMVFNQFVLLPRQRWDESSPDSASKRDWYPWRYNRRLSVLRRPLVQFSKGVDPDVLLSAARFEHCLKYLVQVASGHLPGSMFDSQDMKRYIGRVVDQQGHAFNKKVGARFRGLGWQVSVELQMTYFGAARRLGDVDVVAWRTDVDVVYVVECKRLRMDRTIGEVGERLKEYGVGARAEGEALSELGKHQRRLDYLRTKGRARLAELTGGSETKMDVRSALVTDVPTPMQFHREHADSIDVVADYATLEGAVGGPGCAR